MLCAINFASQAQSIIIDSTFTTDAEIFPFNPNDTIYGLGLSGNITLNSDTSLVRLIFIDSDYNEHMLYEAYPFITDSSSISFSNVSDETKYLDITQPYSLYIHVYDASIELTSLHCAAGPVDYADSLQLLYKQYIEDQKIASINANIEKHEMIWFADETSVSHLSYAEKKVLFGVNYNLHGFEYYSTGIYDFSMGASILPTNSNLVPEFDWRNRHSANEDIIPNSPYYDSFLGWMTPVGSQLCNHCWIFAPVHTIEATVNLYFNQQINLDLSEQSVASCQVPLDKCNGGAAQWSFSYFRDSIIVDETCFPYNTNGPSGYENDCNKCLNPGEGINIVNYFIQSDSLVSDEIKTNIITKGPIVMGIDAWWHYMTFLGFGEVKYLDEIFTLDDDDSSKIITDPEDPLIGRNYWLVKNSWGQGWGESGFGRIFCPTDEFYDMIYVETPVISSVNPYTISCLDVDNDGYYNWGISTIKPDTCPSCPNKADSDDSEPRIGPYDDYYFGTPVRPLMEVGTAFQEILNGGFYTFNNLNTSQSFEFIVTNQGNAQLNFDPEGLLPQYAEISITGADSNHFTYNQDLAIAVKMNGDTAFSITYDGLCSGSATCVVTIHLNEPDMDDFVFAIVYADCDQTPTNITISGTETWSDWRVINDNYKIEHGGKLTITGHIGFSDQVNFIVDKGGEVIIDGGVLTNACSSTWNGIDVWGDASLSQYPSSNQGCLKIINGGCIENSEAAVQLTKIANGVSQSTKNGGILRCDSALFKNNEADVIFYSYNNFDPNTLVKHPNRSYFYNTQFINDQICKKDSCVFLQNVDGIIFKGCTFINAVDKSSCQTTFSKEKGILSFNSGFYVDDLCLDNNIPCSSSRPCLFKNLDYGIYALNAEFNEIISIDTAIFHNTCRGIYLNLVSYPEVIRNQFIYDEDYELSSGFVESYGLDLEHCRNFVVEENAFSNTSTASNMLGLQVLNAGPYAHEIYNNSFTGFTTGITAAGVNRDDDGVGLCIKCNDFTGCSNDIFVTPELDIYGNPIIPSNEDIGIAEKQGEENIGGNDPAIAAGNTFSEGTTEEHYINDPDYCSAIIYTHHDEQSTDEKVSPIPILGSINLKEDDQAFYSKDISCPSNLSGGSGINVNTENSILTQEYVLISSYNDTLNIYTDGGNTENLNTEVQTSFPNEAMEVRQQLLSESPYLSDTIMKSAIYKENVLPNVMIRDILVANPQSAKTPDVMNSIENRFTPMPDYMMDEIMDGLHTTGAKERYQHKLTFHRSKRMNALFRLERLYKYDTVNVSSSRDSLIALWHREPYCDSWYKLSLYYLKQSDSTHLFNTLDSIPLNFELSANEQSVHQQYEDLIDLLWEIHSDTIGIDSTMIQSLFAISGNSSIPGIIAMNYLVNESLLLYSEKVYLPGLLKAFEINSDRNNTSKNNHYLRVYPNPAAGYFILEYIFSSSVSDPSIEIIGINGMHYKHIGLNKSQNQEVISTADLSNGIYLIQLRGNNSILDVIKIVISK